MDSVSFENILVILFLGLLLYYGFFLISILKGIKKLKPVYKKILLSEFITIIIPFRNEEGNILNNLKSIEAQNYPEEKFEVIYVNDSSEDDSFEILNSNIENKNIRILCFPPGSGSSAFKKRAIKFGIDNSKGEIIVSSDADCVYNKNWLQNLISAFESNVDFVSGPVQYIEKINLFSKLQVLEFAGLILAGAGLIAIEKPVICNGANIAFRKNIFKKLNGLEDKMDISSGDDAFLMQKIHKQNRKGVKFCLNKDSIVKTEPSNSFYDFYQQRKRWASKNIFYKNKKLTAKLIMIFLFYLGIIIQTVLALFLSFQFIITLMMSLLFKYLLEYLILKKGKEILFPELKLKYLFIAEVFQIPYILAVSLAGLFGNIIWKGRKIKR